MSTSNRFDVSIIGTGAGGGTLAYALAPSGKRILLLERGPGREHIAIQSYMLALVAALGALYALVLAVQPVRDFFDLTRMGGGQLFLALLSAAGGLVLASVVWRIPAIEQLEEKPPPPEEAPTGPVTAPMPAAPTPVTRTGEG